jgi:hypothetical protein
VSFFLSLFHIDKNNCWDVQSYSLLQLTNKRDTCEAQVIYRTWVDGTRRSQRHPRPCRPLAQPVVLICIFFNHTRNGSRGTSSNDANVSKSCMRRHAGCNPFCFSSAPALLRQLDFPLPLVSVMKLCLSLPTATPSKSSMSVLAAFDDCENRSRICA